MAGGTFGLLGISATVNRGLRGFVWLWVFTFPVYWVEVGSVLWWWLRRNCPIPFQGSRTISPSLTWWEDADFSLFSSALAVFCSLIRAILTDEKCHCLWFWLAFPYWLIMLNVFIYLLAIFVSPKENLLSCVGASCVLVTNTFDLSAWRSVRPWLRTASKLRKLFFIQA